MKYIDKDHMTSIVNTIKTEVDKKVESDKFDQSIQNLCAVLNITATKDSSTGVWNFTQKA